MRKGSRHELAARTRHVALGVACAAGAGMSGRRSIHELVLENRIQRAGLPPPVLEHRFAPPRLWRFDFAWPAQMVAAEAEGGTWSGGRHTRGGGFEDDCEKYSRAAILGWRVLRFTPHMIADGTAAAMLQEALAPR